jgi:phage terminase large subunit
MDIDIDVDVNEVYIPYLTDDTRYQIFFGGSSSGKSYFLAQRTVLDILGGHRNYLIVRQHQNTVKRSVYNEITKSIATMGLSAFFVENKSEMTITCKPNKKQILFAGLDDPEKIKSITPIDGVVTDVWIEEATETTFEAVRQLDKRLRGRSKVKKRLTMSFNPVLKDHWLYKEYFKRWDESRHFYKDSHLSILKTTHKDNDFLEPDDHAALENETDRYYYEVYTLGNWGVLGNLIFKNWETRDLSDIRHTFDNLRHGLDFGFADDPAALPCMHYDKKRRTLYIFDEVYGTGMTNDVLADTIRPHVENRPVICDNVESKSIKELRQFGINAIPAVKGKDSVRYGIQWLQRQKIIIDVKCVNTKMEFQKYKWLEDKYGNVLPEPVDKDNHIIDAIRYGMEYESLGRGKKGKLRVGRR